MTIADIEVLSTSPVPSESLIDIKEFFDVPSFGIVKGKSISFIIVSGGKKCLESPIACLFTQPLNELEEGIGLCVGELEGKLCRGKARPTAPEAFGRDAGKLLAKSRLHGHGNEQVKLRILVDLVEELLCEVFCVSEDQDAGFVWLKDVFCQIEQLRCGLRDRSGRSSGREADRLSRIRIEGKEGLSHLCWAGSVVFAMATHLAFAVAAYAMRIDGEEFPLVVSGSSPQESERYLKSLRVRDRERGQELMDREVGHDERKTVDQFEPLLAQRPFIANTRDAQGCFMDQLESDPWLDALAWLPGPSA